MDTLLHLFAALSDPTRVRALMALREGELCVCQITALLELAPSTISKHMSILRHAGLVSGRKQGRWMHYSRPAPNTDTTVHTILQIIDSYLDTTPQVQHDRRRLTRIIEQITEQPCQSNTRN